MESSRSRILTLLSAAVRTVSFGKMAARNCNGSHVVALVARTSAVPSAASTVPIRSSACPQLCSRHTRHPQQRQRQCHTAYPASYTHRLKPPADGQRHKVAAIVKEGEVRLIPDAHIASGEGHVWPNVSREGDAAGKAVVGPDLCIEGSGMPGLRGPQSPRCIGTAREGIHIPIIKPVIGTITSNVMPAHSGVCTPRPTSWPL